MDGVAGPGFVGEVVLLAMGLLAAGFSLYVRDAWAALPSRGIFVASATITLLAWAFGLAEEFATSTFMYAVLDGVERALLAASAVCFFLWALRLPRARVRP